MRIRVPASIANIGSGFDCMAMAIDLWLEVIAEPRRQALVGLTRARVRNI